MPSSRSMSDQRRAQASPRRMPVVITSQTRVPQSSSMSNALSTRRAASAGEGGLGWGGVCLGRWATFAGVGEEPFPADGGGERTGDYGVDLADGGGGEGLHLWGPHFLALQSWLPLGLCSMKGLPSQRIRQRRSSAYRVSRVRAVIFLMGRLPRTGRMLRLR